jgi:hypothetical protein
MFVKVYYICKMITLQKTLSIQTFSGAEWRMFAFIVRECKRIGADVKQDKAGNLYVTKGRADKFPCIVAHMDSVHKIGADLSIIEAGGLLTGFNYKTMQQTGIGGDDKVGVYIALKCLEKYDTIKLAFFVDEERGCIGSAQARMDFFNDCFYVLQADRRGNSDFITNASGVKLCSRKFKKAVKPLIDARGYSFNDGMMTDVMQLKQNGLNVSCANISCGYYRPHADDEYVNVKDVERCLSLFEAIIENLREAYEHTYTPREYTPTYYNPSYYSQGWRARDYSAKTTYKSTSSYKSKYDSFWTDDFSTAENWRKAEDEKLYYCDNCTELHVSTSLHYNADFNAFLCVDCSAIYA